MAYAEVRDTREMVSVFMWEFLMAEVTKKVKILIF